jgi:hypothetical protein
MNYIKLTAKPNTWFKEGTEVYHEDNRRFTFDEWEYHKENYIGVILYGVREEDNNWDEEFCDFDEFIVELVENDQSSQH